MEFHPIKIQSIEKTTEDCVILEFKIPENLQSEFNFIQGQYLTLQTTINGENVRRSYSLCTSPLDGKWKVAVKHVPGGAFSTYANESLQKGDELQVAIPNGKFYVAADKDQDNNYVCFAAGSGITPILSIIKTHLLSEEKAHFKLFFVNQYTHAIILKEELEALKNQFLDRFEIFHFLTKEHRSVDLFNGRIDTDKLNKLSRTILPIKQIDHYFICGPEAMIFCIRDFLLEQGVKKEAIHFELFNAGNKVQVQTEHLAKELKGKDCEITIQEGGKQWSFNIAQGSNNILDAALIHAADLPYACKGGVCCTCRAKLIEGEVTMAVHYGLEDDEVEKGFILTCQAIPTTEKIVVDFDV